MTGVIPSLGRMPSLGKLATHGRPDNWTPLGRIQSGMVLDFTSATISDTLAARGFTFTRSGATATRVNSSGVLETVAANTLRIDHDPTTLACLGGLFEEASTNYALHSATFTNAAWVKTNVTAAQTQTGPDGVANSASLLTATAANGTALQALTRASAARISSVYVKRVTGSGNVDVTQDNGTTWATVTVTSGWTRVSIASATAANPTVGLRIVTPGDEVAVFGFQHEEKAFATSYIPTSTAAVTRNADSLTLSDLTRIGYSATAGTVVVRSRALGFSAASSPAPYMFGVGSLSSNELSVYFDGSARKTVGEARSGGAVQMSMSAAEVIAAGASYISALAWAENDAALVVNGGTPVTDTSIVLPVGIDRVSIGGRQARGQTAVGSQIISRLDYYNRRLSNAELQSITT